MLEFAASAIRALRDANLDMPGDVSVIGFDNIQLAVYHTPRLRTIRQPLRDMGETRREFCCSGSTDFAIIR